MTAPDFARLVESVPVLLIYLNEECLLAWANGDWREYTGIVEFPQPATCAVHSDQEGSLRESLARILESPRRMTSEVQLRRLDGEYRWFQLKIVPYSQEDGRVFMAGSLFDLTDVKMIEEQMMELNNSLEGLVEEQTRHLKQANEELKETQSQMLQNEKMASIGQLAAGVAHEINNPMGFIGSNLNSLAKYLSRIGEFLRLQDDLIGGCLAAEKLEELREKRRKYKIDYLLEDSVELIEESLEGSTRVQKIVQDLKSFSRVDRAEVQRADLNECLNTTISIVWNELKYKTTLEKEYGELDPLFCHPQQLNQVFMNILVNAAQAIEKQGVVKVRTWQDPDHQYVAISDNGSGIPPEIRGKIFEPFFTTKEVGAGTGLGMSIGYDIVKKHGGEIRLESQVGAGSTFTVVLPRSGVDPREVAG